jgi:hypothetical protein
MCWRRKNKCKPAIGSGIAAQTNLLRQHMVGLVQGLAQVVEVLVQEQGTPRNQISVQNKSARSSMVLPTC